ncbi:MAG TPA: HAD hydrolase family protein, partial [Trueperaceae bacterium]
GLSASFYPPSHFDYRETLSVMSVAAGKGAAARWLRAHLGLQDLPVLAIGDSPDDVSMFALGTGVAPASASAEALAAADWAACHCDEGAVAAALERYCFAGGPSLGVPDVAAAAGSSDAEFGS